jgi:hypothetical protein
LAWDSRDSLLILFRHIQEPSRQSRAFDFSGRDRIAKSPIATLTRCDSRASDRGASPGPAPLTPQRLVQYARVVVLHSSLFVELVGNLADSRYAVSEHPDKGVQKRACQQRTTFRVDDSLASKAEVELEVEHEFRLMLCRPRSRRAG